MSNRQFMQSNIDKHSPSEISLSKRVYAFSALPKETQEKLFRLQNTDGDFLKLNSGETARLVVFMVLWIFFFIGLAAIVADDVDEEIIDLKRIVVFSIDSVLLFLWFVYFAGKLSRAFGSPLKNRIYLTPTQVIETLDKMVRFRELKDADEIGVNEFWTDNSRHYTLDIKFNDGDAYSFYVARPSRSIQLSKMQELQQKASDWKEEAVGAFERGDTDYLKSHDIFSDLAESNTPVLPRQFRTQKENFLLILTIALIALNGAFVFF